VHHNEVLLVSAGMLKPKKADNDIHRLNLYLNYGLLGLASIIDEAGYSAQVVHGRFTHPEDLIDDLETSGLLRTTQPIMLSLPSSFCLEWADLFSRGIKQRFPKSAIVAGGRWVLGPHASWAEARLPAVDLFVYGTAEGRILQLLQGQSSWHGMPSSSGSRDRTPEPPLQNLPKLNYLLMKDFKEYHPSLEMSRGCGFSCSFCVERDVKLEAMRDPESTAAELSRYANLYGSASIHPYFEASYFRPTRPWIEAFRDVYCSSGLDIQWRCETRVDTWPPSDITKLAAAGLRVIDLGLESGSPTQLMAMGKTRNPGRYLKKAGELLEACHDAGVWAKVNILLYAGETRSSIEETTLWLDHYRQCIKGLSVSPLIMYRSDADPDQYLHELLSLGARPVEEGSLRREGYGLMHLSKEMTHDDAVEASLELSRMFMSSRDYFDLKSFSYFPRSLSWEDFNRIAAATASDTLPFSRPAS